jgi:hypothetical protein
MRIPEPLPDVQLVTYASARDIVYHFFRFDGEDYDPAEFQGGFEDEHGEAHEMSFDEFVEATEEQDCWAWVDKHARIIHLWPGSATDKELLVLLGHELGHVTGMPLEGEMAEEERCDGYGLVAAKTVELVGHVRGCCQPPSC